MTLRVRFAPSPTGSLHLGNARTALFNWLVARKSGGAFVLRIEDTDVEREQQGSEGSILEDLLWLGLDWDEGPDRGGPFGPYRQSERAALYDEAAGRLLAEGKAYRCFCTDAELEAERAAQRAAGHAPRYSGRCRGLDAEKARARAAANEPCAIRFRTVPPSARPSDLTVTFDDKLHRRLEFSAAELGDPVLVRRDGRPTYNFAVVVDDVAMKISLVLRGDDHLSNTPRQVLLFRALGHALPEFAHLPMVRGPDGDRLSKRHGATSVADCRRRGYPPAAVRNSLALLGWSPVHDRPILTLEEMIAEFDLERVSRSPGIFDPAKLDWISSQHIHGMAPEQIAPEAASRLIEAGLISPDSASRPAASKWLEELGLMLRDSIERFEQVPERCAGVFAPGGRPESAEAKAILAQSGARAALERLAVLAEERPPLGHEDWRSVVESLRRETGLKGKALFLPIRVAITGRDSGPELDLLVPLVTRGSQVFPERIASVPARVRRTLEEWE